MPASLQQLLEIEPDKLFERYTVSEIVLIQKSIAKEIERKKEELRTLVGERYRDLIEAADTIADMKILSEEVISDVKNMNGALAMLQKKQTTVTLQPKEQMSSLKQSPKDVVAAQIKLIVDLPELIWSAIDVKDYIRATQLFLLGRHVKTGFSVDKSLKQISPGLLILARQWSTLSHFPKLILKAIENDLQLTNLRSQEACCCLVSIALLENTSLVQKFLSLRTHALQNALCGSDVKARIIDSHDLVVNTIYALHYCFSETGELGKGLVWEMIQKNSSKQGPAVVSYLESSSIINHLPPVILQFRANPLMKSEMIPPNELKESVADWLDLVREYIGNRGKLLLKNISTLRSLQSLTAFNIRLCSEWALVLKSLGISDNLDLWNDVYRPIINSRAKDLISLHWNEAFEDIIKEFKNTLNEDIEKKPELDLRWYIWKESPNNLDLKSNGEHPRGLWLKAKGISPRITKICGALQTKLETLFKDVSDLCSSDDILTTDSKELRSHHQNACLNIILRLKEFVRDLINKDETNETHLAITARFLQTIPELCPALQKCLTIADENKANSWHEAKTLLFAESLSCWSYWEDKTVKRLIKIIPDFIKVPETYADLLSIIPQWDLVVIEEGEEGENIQKSQLKIPSLPSLPLQSLLYYISSEISRVHVPRLIYENVLQKVIPEILKIYPVEVLCQAQALQYLFDFKYLLAQFIPTTNKELNNKCYEKLSTVESKIDPFDLDVSSPHIHNNVKSSVQRLQGLYGMSVYLSDLTTVNVKISEDPCIISLSKTSANVWFPPLPVTNPSNRPVQIMKSKPSLSAAKQTMENTSEMIIKGSTTASSFFTDWFS